MSSQAKLDDYYCGGYFLIRAENPEWVKDNDALPKRVISLSECISQQLMITWGWIPSDKQAALDFGIAEEKLDDFVNHWCQQTNSSDLYPGLFHTVQEARDFIEKYISKRENLYLIGIGLNHQLAGKKQFSQETNRAGIEKLLKQKRQLERDGMVLGHEVVGFWHSSFACSWLCNGLEVDMYEEFAIRPNQYGLISKYSDAKTILDWIMVAPESRAEPTDYLVWLLVSYPLA